MNDHRRTETLAAPAAALFNYLADVRNLPSYFSSITSATPAEGEAVHVVAEVNGTTEQGEAWFRVDTEQQHLEWGSEGPNDYHGELDVTGDDTTATVTLILHTEHGDSDQVDQGITSTLASIKSLVEADEAPASS